MTFCAHCGWNLESDKPVTRGCWELSPLWAKLDGKPCNLTYQQAGILHTLASADQVVTTEALLNRHSGVENPNLIAAQISKMRRKLGADLPVQSVFGIGYQWSAA